MKSMIKYMTAVLSIILFTACESKWDNHFETGELRGKTLFEAISEDPQTSAFAAILVKTGYGDLLSGDKTLSVFAPVNASLSGVDMNDMDALKALVRNHIAYSAYTLVKGNFTVDSVVMINGKKSELSGLKVADVELASAETDHNISVRNGILHKMTGVITSKLNIWEYLQTISSNLQVEYIKSQDKKIMDMDKSIQTGVDPHTGKPLYDTVWINTNPFLQAYPIHDESKNFTFALLPNTVVSRIETKYAKYFVKQNTTRQDSIVRAEFIKDCVLFPVEITADGRFLSTDGVLLDIKSSNIQSTYKASNGMVYVLSDADVKIYENKVKTILIEGENYKSVFSNNGNSWMTRFRPTLSGGKDMVLNSPTVYVTKYIYTNPDTTMNVAISRTFYPISSSNVGNVNNCYIEFQPVINSVAYKVYWSAYDDYSSHINLPVHLSINNGTTTETVDTLITCKFSQKLLLSLPDNAKLTRNPSDGTITNNFSSSAVFTSTRLSAGIQQEKQLYRTLLSQEASHLGFMLPLKNATYTDENDFFMFYSGSDALGDKETIINPTYGAATLWVANTTESKASNSGMIFLDYIKLVPIVDPNE